MAGEGSLALGEGALWVMCLDMHLTCTGVRQRVEMLLEAKTLLESGSWTPL